MTEFLNYDITSTPPPPTSATSVTQPGILANTTLWLPANVHEAGGHRRRQHQPAADPVGHGVQPDRHHRDPRPTSSLQGHDTEADTATPRLFVELVNTLTQDYGTSAATARPATSTSTAGDSSSPRTTRGVQPTMIQSHHRAAEHRHGPARPGHDRHFVPATPAGTGSATARTRRSPSDYVVPISGDGRGTAATFTPLAAASNDQRRSASHGDGRSTTTSCAPARKPTLEHVRPEQRPLDDRRTGRRRRRRHRPLAAQIPDRVAAARQVRLLLAAPAAARRTRRPPRPWPPPQGRRRLVPVPLLRRQRFKDNTDATNTTVTLGTNAIYSVPPAPALSAAATSSRYVATTCRPQPVRLPQADPTPTATPSRRLRAAAQHPESRLEGDLHHQDRRREQATTPITGADLPQPGQPGGRPTTGTTSRSTTATSRAWPSCSWCPPARRACSRSSSWSCPTRSPSRSRPTRWT